MASSIKEKAKNVQYKDEILRGDDSSPLASTLDDSENVQIKGSEKKTVAFYALFRYADNIDRMLVFFGCIFSIAIGVAFPVNLTIFSKIVTILTAYNGSNVTDQVKGYMVSYGILGGVSFIVGYLQMLCLITAAKRQSRRIRMKLFKQILRQDVPWFEQMSGGELITQLSESIEQIEGGIGDKLGNVIQNLVFFLGGVINGFITGWKLSLVSMAMSPLVVLAFAILGYGLRQLSALEMVAYSRAGTVAWEVLTSIRTVFAFGGQSKESVRYANELGAAATVAVKKAAALGFGMGFVGCAFFCSAALTFWYGVKLMAEDQYESGDVVLIVLSLLVGSISLGKTIPEFEFFAQAKAAATDVFEIIERIPTIDKDAKGKVLPDLVGNITFKDIEFVYPMRPEVTILKKFSLKVKSGQTIAIVGPSGSGKSTTVQLLQRFYDPTDGTVQVDGVDLRELDLPWYRSQLGVVSQEPVLFAGTISDNIRMGKVDATQMEVEAAAKMADAHDFILLMPQAYDTWITEGGGRMSGGQKQRIAIARAMIRNPRILLLDEATSALDTRSEKAVQAALNRARRGRTVLMIAHRLTTVRDADRIIVVDRGVVKESGTHDELLQLNGIYANMLNTQSAEEALSDGDSDDEFEDPTTKGMALTLDEMEARNIWLKNPDSDGAESVVSSIASMASIAALAKSNSTVRAIKMSKPEYPILFAGLIMAFASGFTQPAFSLVYSEMFSIFQIRDDNERVKQTSFISGMMVLVAFLRLICAFSENFLLGYSGSRLTMRARGNLFDSMLTQEAGWFDRKENQPGILTARLATEIQSLQKVSGTQLGVMIEGLCLVIVSLAIAFYYSWQLALVNLCFFPIVVMASSFQFRQLSKTTGNQDIAGAQVAQEAFSADRTVFALGLESLFYERFKEQSSETIRSRYSGALLFALVHAISNSLVYFQTAASFYVGVILLDQKVIEVLGIFRTFSAMNFGAQGLGRTAAMAPDIQKAKAAAGSIFKTLDRQTLMDVNEGIVPAESFDGRIEFKGTYFRYPTRTELRIIKNFNFVAESGMSVALVGASGCGKSTLLQLVQRLYDVSDHGPDNGIFMNGYNIRELSPTWIRQQIGIVSQEPNLFDMTIADNIAYGDNAREVSKSEIIEAAKQANIHNFVMSLPEGYETNVGARGSQLSGGQKQRVAIARALLRNPKLLLLDEATSALDNESERVVQAALDGAMQLGSRTTLVVAHRLTTVENCNYIVVLEQGRKIESGPPRDLMELRGAYYTLHNVDAAVEEH